MCCVTIFTWQSSNQVRKYFSFISSFIHYIFSYKVTKKANDSKFLWLLTYDLKFSQHSKPKNDPDLLSEVHCSCTKDDLSDYKILFVISNQNTRFQLIWSRNCKFNLPCIRKCAKDLGNLIITLEKFPASLVTEYKLIA